MIFVLMPLAIILDLATTYYFCASTWIQFKHRQLFHPWSLNYCISCTVQNVPSLKEG